MCLLVGVRRSESLVGPGHTGGATQSPLSLELRSKDSTRTWGLLVPPCTPLVRDPRSRTYGSGTESLNLDTGPGVDRTGSDLTLGVLTGGEWIHDMKSGRPKDLSLGPRSQSGVNGGRWSVLGPKGWDRFHVTEWKRRQGNSQVQSGSHSSGFFKLSEEIDSPVAVFVLCLSKLKSLVEVPG